MTTAATANRATYATVPRPHDREIVYRLTPDTLEVDNGTKSWSVRLAAIQAVRLTFEPKSTLTSGYRATLTIAGRRNLKIGDISWKSLVETTSKREDYRAFIEALIAAVAVANPRCRFVAGRSPAAWGLTVAVSMLVFAGLGLFVVRAFMETNWAFALFLAVFTLYFGHTVARMIVKNRPRTFAPEAPPADLLP